MNHVASALRQHNIVTLLCLSVQTRNFLGTILQVAIHHHHPVAMTVIQPCGDAIVLTEVTAKLDAAHASIRRSQTLDYLP